MSIPMAMAVIGGLGIFMLGMKYMSEGMQAVAGNSLRRMISLVTNNRLMATGAGTAVTVLVQSSTITTVLVVGLANAGLMQLHQAIGVIMGANIGTTITGWILVLKIGKYGLPILGAAALVYLFGRGDRLKFIAMAVMGLGMVFFGLELMKDGFAPMKDIPMFVEAFAWFSADTYGGILASVFIGCVLTLLVQSSSATLGITIGLAATGVIPFTTAAALVLGENLGTTITVVLASIGATTNAKRTAAAHVFFNMIGVVWITLLFPVYIRLIGAIVAGVHGADPRFMVLADFANPLEFAAVVTAGIALTHTGFNVANTIIFLPFLRPFARFLEWLVPETAGEVPRLRHLDARAVDAPVLGVEQSRAEVAEMGREVVRMIDEIREIGFNGSYSEALSRRIFEREESLDTAQQEIVAFLTEVLDATVPHAIAEEGRRQLRIAHELESTSDRLASLLKDRIKLRERGLEMPSEQQDQLARLHDDVAALLRSVVSAYEQRTTMNDEEARMASMEITRTIKRLREEHLQHMTDNPVDPFLSMIYIDMLADYRRVRAHAQNMHEAMPGAQGGTPG
jgi:phosphate:Na+ symporter